MPQPVVNAAKTTQEPAFMKFKILRFAETVDSKFKPENGKLVRV